MLLLQKLFRLKPGYYAAAAAAGALIAGLSLWRAGVLSRIAWMDALTTAGGILVLLGALALTARLGAFDIFGFAFSTLGRRRHETLYDYSAARTGKNARRPWNFMAFITVGAVCLLAGLLVGAA